MRWACWSSSIIAIFLSQPVLLRRFFRILCLFRNSCMVVTVSATSIYPILTAVLSLLIAVGPLTNIALALRLDPQLPKRVRQLIVMGGTLYEAGNVSPVAEANFLADPHAADEVFAVNWPATIVGLDVTHRVMLNASDLARIGKGSKRYGKTLHAASAFYMDYYHSTTVGQLEEEPACAMHDATALIYMLQPESFTTEIGPVRIVSEGISRGQLTMARKGYRYLLQDWENRDETTACVGVNPGPVRRLFIDTLVC